MDEIRDMLKKLSIEEKAKLCVGKNYWQTCDNEILGLLSMFMCDGPSGLRKQEILQEDNSEKEITKNSVCFPSGAALASSWDKNLLFRVGNSLGKKASEEDVDILLAPSMNIKRSPLCGRNFEYYSEDPVVSGELAASFISGVQQNKVAACPKHFAMNNQETKRKAIDVIVGEREMREIYLYGFELAVKKADPWCIMSSYNKINGKFPAENHHILREILREEWQFDGIVISDWGAIDQIVPSVEESFNLQMPGNRGYSVSKLVEAVKNGELKEERLDEAAVRMIQLAKKTIESRRKTTITDEELHRQAYEAAVDSMVLLKNQDHILPLSKEERILVVGEMAVRPRYQVGGGSAFIQSYQVDIPWNEIHSLSPTADFTLGYSGDEDHAQLLEEAAEKAVNADKVVIFAGLPVSYESEGYDRKKLDIPDNQIRLIRHLSKFNKNLIVVLANGSAVTMPWISKTKAVLEGYLGGEAMGKAVAELLYGIKNPSGKLAETFPVRLEHTPAFLNFPGDNNQVEYREGIFVGYRYYEKKKIKPLFSFGHGLSYTEFKYSNLQLRSKVDNTEEPIHISLRVKNTGAYYGKEVIQLYLGKMDSKVSRALKELKAFEKVALMPGEEKVVNFELNKRDLSYYNPIVKEWIAEAGTYQVYLGSSSSDIRLKQKFELMSGDRALLPITRNTNFGDVFDIPELKEIFLPFFDNLVANIPLEFGIGDKNGQLAQAMLRGMTFSSISSYIGKEADDQYIDTLLKQLNEKLDIL